MPKLNDIPTGDPFNGRNTPASTTDTAWEEGLSRIESKVNKVESTVDKHEKTLAVQNEKAERPQHTMNFLLPIFGIFSALAIFFAGLIYAEIRELRQEFANTRERLAVMETIHSKRHLQSAHIGPIPSMNE